MLKKIQTKYVETAANRGRPGIGGRRCISTKGTDEYHRYHGEDSSANE